MTMMVTVARLIKEIVSSAETERKLLFSKSETT